MQLSFKMKPLLIGIFVFLIAHSEAKDSDSKSIESRRPFYIIANMANNVTEAEKFLGEGANGLQIDVQFSLTGNPKLVQHGAPCSCNRNCLDSTPFKDYLSFVRRSTTPGTNDFNPRLTLLFMNLKVSALTRGALYSAGEKLADAVINYLYARGKSASRVWVVLGLPDLRTVRLLRGFQDAFRAAKFHWNLEKFGYNVYHYGRLENLKASLFTAGVKNHVWVGTGTSNCQRRTILPRLIRLNNERELVRQLGSGFVDKVYTWTVDQPEHMREVVKLGVDAIITNKPNILKHVLRESQFDSNIRAADSADVPWKWTASTRKDEDDDGVITVTSTSKPSSVSNLSKSSNTSGSSSPDDGKKYKFSYQDILDEIDRELANPGKSSEETDPEDGGILQKILAPMDALTANDRVDEDAKSDAADADDDEWEKDPWGKLFRQWKIV